MLILGSERTFVLVEAFCIPCFPNESLPKRSRVEEDLNQPALTSSSNLSSSVLHSFVIAVRCWDLLHHNESIERGKKTKDKKKSIKLFHHIIIINHFIIF